MRIIIPLKTVVLVWGLLSAMILVAFIASSMIQGKNPFPLGAAFTRSSNAKARSAPPEQRAKRPRAVGEHSGR